MASHAPIQFAKRMALAGLFACGVVGPLSAADLRELLAQEAAAQELEAAPEEPAVQEEEASPEEGDGFFNSLSDFLGSEQPAEEAPPQEVDDSFSDDWADEAGFGAQLNGRDESTYYEGQALEPEASDMFDDAFGDDTVRAAPDEEGDEQGPAGPAADDAPEEFADESEIETQELAAPEGAEEMDIFGRPKDGSKLAAAGEEAEADEFQFDLSDLPPVEFEVPGNATVTVRALDKITARMSEHKLKVDTPYNFGTLTIVMRTCAKSPPEEEPEVKAFLQIADNRPEMENKAWFSGWMFASSPAISALEHPVYDVWVIDCNIVSASADDDSL